MTLSYRRTRFVQEYCKDGNAKQAAIRAGYSEDTAGMQGSRLLTYDEVKNYLAEYKLAIAENAQITPTLILQEWRRIAMADPNELTQVRRVCCRHCYGFGYAYQWTEAEYSDAVNRAVDGGKPAPACDGGFGFDRTAGPNIDCTECKGLGHTVTHFADTRKLSVGGKRLFAGVKQTKDGLEIKMRDQDAALQNLSKFLGMVVDRKEISGPDGGPVPLAHITADDLSDDQLAAILKADGNAE